MTAFTANDPLVLLELVRYHGDAPISIPLTDPDTGDEFTATGNRLIFTLKASAEDEDEDALVQKDSSVGGITVANPSVVTLVPDDYADIERGVTYEFDVAAFNTLTSQKRTVARGTLRFDHNILRESSISIATVTAQPAFLQNQIPFLGSVTGLTGGGASKLDGQVTVGASAPLVVAISLSDDLQYWKLRTKTTEVEDGVAYVAPDDSSTLIWVRVL